MKNGNEETEQMNREIEEELKKLETAEEKIAWLDSEIEKELKKLTEEEREEVFYIISNGRYGKTTSQNRRT